MARLINGLLSGTVGSMVFCVVKGTPYVRSKAVTNDPATPAQIIQRSKFACVQQFLQPMAELIAVGFRDAKNKIPAFNRALSYHLKHAVAGNSPDLSIDYSKVLISQGKLLNVIDPVVISEQEGMLQFNWTNSAGAGRHNDRTLLAVWSEKQCHCAYLIAGAMRRQETDQLAVPFFSGEHVHTWLGFISQDGKRIASSIYTGLIRVT